MIFERKGRDKFSLKEALWVLKKVVKSSYLHDALRPKVYSKTIIGSIDEWLL